MLTVGSIITGKVIDVDFKGQGVIKSDGYVIFAPRLINDEVVKLKIKKIKKNFCEAEVLEIIEKKQRSYT